jgi:hypothetical protein
VWLITLYTQTTLHVESRLPRRESRGFSRAQAGDALTSVVPLAWSISMLMHASVHSFNFDDNTAETVFSFNVLAYQWGWNYYFPSDVVEQLQSCPKRVGHAAIFFPGQSSYNDLLARYRLDYARRVASQGHFASRGAPLLSPLTFFLRSPEQPSPADPQWFMAGLGVEPRAPAYLLRTLIDASSAAANQEANAPLSAFAWQATSPALRTLHATFETLTDRKAELLLTNLPLRPLRAPSSLALAGNRLALIHSHFCAGEARKLSCAGLDSEAHQRSYLSQELYGANIEGQERGGVEGPGTFFFEDYGLTSAAASSVAGWLRGSILVAQNELSSLPPLEKNLATAEDKNGWVLQSSAPADGLRLALLQAALGSVLEPRKALMGLASQDAIVRTGGAGFVLSSPKAGSSLFIVPLVGRSRATQDLRLGAQVAQMTAVSIEAFATAGVASSLGKVGGGKLSFASGAPHALHCLRRLSSSHLGWGVMPLAVEAQTSRLKGSSWLEGADLTKPTRANYEIADPINFLHGGGPHLISPWRQELRLFAWYSSWGHQTKRYGQPFYKTRSGGLVRR